MQSWADKVRGTTPSVSTAGATSKITDVKEREHQNASPGLKRSSGNVEDCIVQDVNDDGDEEGWETVHRGRKTHSSHTKKGTKIGDKKPSNGKNETKSNNSRTLKVMNGPCSNGDVGNHHGDKEVCSEPKSNAGEASETLMEVSNDKETPAVSFDGEEEEDTLSDIEHEKALSAAMEEEESLSRQIEEWHNQAIASVIEHEESLTKEIAEQEELVTVINGESEGNVSDIGQEEDMENIDGEEDNSLNCSGATNGESVSC